jgi:hypothetical protein
MLWNRRRLLVKSIGPTREAWRTWLAAALIAINDAVAGREAQRRTSVTFKSALRGLPSFDFATSERWTGPSLSSSRIGRRAKGVVVEFPAVDADQKVKPLWMRGDRLSSLMRFKSSR